MEKLLAACKAIFDESPQAVGVAQVLTDEAGEPYDFAYVYLNAAMAAFTGSQVEDLVGIHAYEEWGHDDMGWLEHFADAAFDGVPCEFETVSVMLERFLHVTVTPLGEGRCTFFIQDVTDWVDQEPYWADDLTVGLFFLDLRTLNLMLTAATQERYGFSKGYLPAAAFADELFGPDAAAAVDEQVATMRAGGHGVFYEGRSADGRWLRLSTGRIAQSDRFVFGQVEDTTRAHEAEERSLRRMDVIESLTRENFALYVVDLASEAVEVYGQPDDLSGAGFVRAIVDDASLPAREAYLRDVVAPDDRDRVDAAISRPALDAFFASAQDEMAVTYQRLIDGEEQYIEARIIRLAGCERTAVIAVRNIHSEMEEQLRQKRALQKALELAQHASAAKSTFLTNMSHDFRTPMNAIVGFAGIALEHRDDPDRMAECLEKIQRSSDHLLRLINDVLDVSRIESGVVEVDEEPLDLADLASDMELLFSGEAQRKSLGFSVDAAGLRHPHVLADRQHLGQILVNLIGNAFKFTGPGGRVDVRFAEFADGQSGYGAHVPAGYGRFEVTVSDTGCGMVPEFLDLLFVPFERNGLGEVNPTEGTGLGMPITKNLVELLGGTIEVKSEVGKGSEFTVTLPLRLAEGAGGAEAGDAGAYAAPGAGEDVAAGVAGAEPGVGEDVDGAPGGGGAGARFAGRRLLVVDDDELSREIMKEVLGGAGFAVEEAADGEAAVAAARASAPGWLDGIIMDMRMPRMTGDEAARAIRASGRADLERIPIIALTADAFEEGRRRSREAGMTAHVTKPFKTAELLALLGEHL
ncbi:PAS domain-containing hybrid sensor histidine kinase/response regulator [Adlercreutzia faecimuris]|uniref:histidine kinase n=1 Tax=Adlercreutzia faecimuris TaxID=2897341 RepID=A0ABS9WHM0_9ACTN|nr:hybrid sensor histidine kinase/response regulator [Adlercreutzia sp. JBNU-10]MCI2242354.1 hybrid sensor histidine kinase/response regulator [Adlercreutzia sp. JBNU-10]